MVSQLLHRLAWVGAARRQFPALSRPWQRSLSVLALLIALMGLAALFRIYRLTAPGILVEREYTSAIFARAFYFEHTPSIEPWRVAMARTVLQAQPVLEPPLTEWLVSLMYRVAGREVLWLARLLTSSFWLIGGLCLFALARHFLSTSAAFLALAYYLFVPAGVLASRSFQPDALMMMAFLASLYSLVRYFDQPTLPKLLLAAGLAGLTLLLRPLVVFAIYAALVSMSIAQQGSLRGMFSRPVIIFCVISLILPGAYYGYGLFIAGYMRWKVETSLLTYLYLRREFWREWFLLAVDEVGAASLVSAVLGFGLLRSALARALVVGLVIGYVLFGLTFTYHISTHGYYHLQLIPVVAIAAAPVFDAIMRRTRRALGRWGGLPVLAASVLLALITLSQLRGQLGGFDFENPATAEEIGRLVNHSDATVFLARHYGLPLEYYGELSGAYWPRSVTYWLYRRPSDHALTVRQRLGSLGFSPTYFIITDFAEYQTNHADLRAYLERDCELLADTKQYLIYRHCRDEAVNGDPAAELQPGSGFHERLSHTR
jgi:hypothetical protein